MLVCFKVKRIHYGCVWMESHESGATLFQFFRTEWLRSMFGSKNEVVLIFCLVSGIWVEPSHIPLTSFNASSIATFPQTPHTRTPACTCRRTRQLPCTTRDRKVVDGSAWYSARYPASSNSIDLSSPSCMPHEWHHLNEHGDVHVCRIHEPHEVGPLDAHDVVEGGTNRESAKLGDHLDHDVEGVRGEHLPDLISSLWPERVRARRRASASSTMPPCLMLHSDEFDLTSPSQPDRVRAPWYHAPLAFSTPAHLPPLALRHRPHSLPTHLLLHYSKAKWLWGVEDCKLKKRKCDGEWMRRQENGTEQVRSILWSRLVPNLRSIFTVEDHSACRFANQAPARTGPLLSSRTYSPTKQIIWELKFQQLLNSCCNALLWWIIIAKK
jgi:hypothetical protein